MQLLILVDEAKEAKVDSLRYPFEGLFFLESTRGTPPYGTRSLQPFLSCRRP